MSIKNSCLVLVLLLTVLAFAGCKFFVKDPTVTVQSLTVVSVDPGGAGMELQLKVNNRNPFDLKLVGYDYDLKVLDLPLSKGAGHEEVKFPSHADADFRIPIRVAYRDLLEIFKRKPDLDNIPYHMTARLDLDTPLGRVKVPVDRTGTYALPSQFRPGAMLNRVMDFLRMNR